MSGNGAQSPYEATQDGQIIISDGGEFVVEKPLTDIYGRILTDIDGNIVTV
jgi:hypothetical protein